MTINRMLVAMVTSALCACSHFPDRVGGREVLDPDGCAQGVVRYYDFSWLANSDKQLASERKKGRSSVWRECFLSVQCCRAPELGGGVENLARYVFDDGLPKPVRSFNDVSGEFLCLSVSPPSDPRGRILWVGVLLRGEAFRNVLIGIERVRADVGQSVCVAFPLPPGRWCDGEVPFDVVSFGYK